MKPLTYVASPYSHPNPTVRLERWKAVCRFAGRMLEDGYHVFSPIAHSHPIAIAGDIGTEFDHWESLDMEMLRRCDELIVLQLDGWDASYGVLKEMRVAHDLKMKVRYVAPDAATTPPGSIPDGHQPQQPERKEGK